jgi:hypothetical protein
MLNRTNRTLSATLNRLNLGTRLLVLTTSGNNGKQTLRVRHAHGLPMRDGMFGSGDPSIQSSSRIAISVIPGSSPVVPWPVEGSLVRPPVGDPDVYAALRDRSADAARLLGAAPGQPQARSPQERAKPVREAVDGLRPCFGKASGGVRVRAAWDTAAATTAAAGG